MLSFDNTQFSKGSTSFQETKRQPKTKPSHFYRKIKYLLPNYAKFRMHDIQSRALKKAGKYVQEQGGKSKPTGTGKEVRICRQMSRKLF
jgi:hypothetical protein